MLVGDVDFVPRNLLPQRNSAGSKQLRRFRAISSSLIQSVNDLLSLLLLLGA